MKRLLLLFLTFLTLSCCVCNKPAQHQVKPQMLLDETVALVTEREDAVNTYYTFCSGVWISQSVILTAKHCVAHDTDHPVGSIVRFKTKPEIDIENNKMNDTAPHYGVVIAIGDDNVDLALISSIDTLPGHQYATVADSVELGQDLQIVGHVTGLHYTYIKGTVSATRLRNNAKYLQISSSAFKGNSGGGAFDEQGNLVGICSAIYMMAPNVTLFVHRDEIKEFIQQNIK